MSIHLRLRIIVVVLVGALLIVSLGTALQSREIAMSIEEQLGPDARLLEAAAEMQRLLGDGDRGAWFEQEFRRQLERVEAIETSDVERGLSTRLRATFDEYVAHRHDDPERARAAERAIDQALTEFTAQVAGEATSLADSLATRANTAAVGLGILGVLALVAGAGTLRALRIRLLLRLAALDQAATDVVRGDGARRVAMDGDDELARIARALNHALDLHDRDDAQMRGRNREIRALLVALLRRWPGSAAVTGVDGEVIASTLSVGHENQLRSLTPQVRKAAGILLSRGFASATELETDISFADGSVVHIRALALGEERVVGWLAEFG